MNPLSIMHDSWFPIQGYLTMDPQLQYLNDKVLPSAPYRPAKEDIFKVFRKPVQDIRVVILGQDPYFNKDATGLAFQTAGKKNTKHLKVIYEELKMEGFPDANIDNWEAQGVFLLNTALTVKAGKAGTHCRYWEHFMQRTISYISNSTERCVWMLWGKRAQSFAPFIAKNNNYIMTAPFPIAETYEKSSAGFYGCRHFQKTNEILIDDPIKW